MFFPHDLTTFQRRLFLILCGLALSSPPLLSHDFWLEPRHFQIDAPRAMPVYAMVGERFEGEPIVPAPRLLASFDLVSAGRKSPVLRPPATAIAGLAPLKTKGLHVLAYQGNPSFIELRPAAFHRYLEEEGLTEVLAHRRRNGDQDKPGRELFSRCAKSMIVVGDPTPIQDFERPVGHRLELTPRTNPFLIEEGKPVMIRLSYEGQPLSGALVVAIHRDQPRAPVSARTDAAGEVALPMDRAGAWLVKTVHMVPYANRAKAEWESVWASLTFMRE